MLRSDWPGRCSLAAEPSAVPIRSSPSAAGGAPPMKSFSPPNLPNSKINFSRFFENGRPLKSANLKFVKQFGVFEKYFS